MDELILSNIFDFSDASDYFCFRFVCQDWKEILKIYKKTFFTLFAYNNYRKENDVILIGFYDNVTVAEKNLQKSSEILSEKLPLYYGARSILKKNKYVNGIEIDDEQEIVVEIQKKTKYICYSFPKMTYIRLRTYCGGWRDLNEIDVENISIGIPKELHPSNCCFLKKMEVEYFWIKVNVNETLEDFKEFFCVF
jgi:hypothetical protein